LVYILDEGSVFEAPLSRIWEYVQSDDEHDHTAVKTISVEMQGDSVALITNEVNMGGSPMRNKLKLTFYPPFGIVQEYLEGPMTGTKAFQFYIPKGERTGVTVVGEFVGKGMDDQAVKKAAMGLL